MADRRILMTTDAVGGAWEYSLELCRGLAGAGVEVVLAVMGPAPDARQRAAAAGVADLVEAPYRLEWMEDPWADVARAGEWLLGLEADRGCRLVHLGGYAHGALPFRSPRLIVAHSCVLSWWRAVRGEDAPASWDHYRSMVRAGLDGADRVVAPTRWMLVTLRELHGPLPEAEVIPNGRDPARYRVAHKEPLVLSAGRVWDEAKNAAALDRVAPRLPWPVHIAGAGSPDGTAPSRPRGGAHLLGRLSAEEMAALYSRAAIYTMPARYEPFGLSVLEAALSGCALVLSDLPSLRELWSEAAVFVSPSDEPALERALCSLIDSPPLRQSLAARARSRALELTSQRMTARYLDLYRTLLDEPLSR
jgi:glycogen(starch) synthase